MTIEIGSKRRVLEEEVRNRTKFENRRVLVTVEIRRWEGDQKVGGRSEGGRKISRGKEDEKVRER